MSAFKDVEQVCVAFFRYPVYFIAKDVGRSGLMPGPLWAAVFLRDFLYLPVVLVLACTDFVRTLKMHCEREFL